MTPPAGTLLALRLPSLSVDVNPRPTAAGDVLGWCGLSPGPWLRPARQPLNWYDPETPPPTWGPSHKEPDARWAVLAACPPDLVDVDVLAQTAGELALEYRIGGGPTLWETYERCDGGLTYTCRLQSQVAGFRFNLPLPHAVLAEATVHRVGSRLEILHSSGCLRLTCLRAEQQWEMAPLPFLLGEEVYRHFYLQGRGTLEYAMRLEVIPAGSG